MQLFKHIFIRIIILFVGWIISAIVATMFLDPNRWCGTGDALAYAFAMMIFYIIWAIFLLIEAYFLHKKRSISLRNSNLILALLLPTYILIMYIFFWN